MLFLYIYYREQRRIEMMNKNEYQVKIFFNGQEKGVSNAFRLSAESDYSNVDFQQTFHLWIREKPRTLSLQINYSKSNTKKWIVIANIPISIPLPSVFLYRSAISKIEIKYFSFF